MHIYRFLGYKLCFDNGFDIGFSWVHGNGQTSKQTASLASYHHPNSITWRWALYWAKPTKKTWWMLKLHSWKPRKNSGMGSRGIVIPLIGEFTVRWQEHMFRK